MIDPKELTITEGHRLIDQSLPEDVDENLDYEAGDHWQEGRGWIGPMPTPGADGEEITREQIRKSFISTDRIGEVVDRHVRGVIGNTWVLTAIPIAEDGSDMEEPSDELVAESEGLVDILEAWFLSKKGKDEILKAIRFLLYSSQQTVRLLVPAGKLEGGEVVDETGTESESPEVAKIPKAETLEEQLDLLWVEAPKPTDAMVYEDPDTRDLIGIYAFDEVEEATNQRVERLEVSWLDEEGRTVYRLISKTSKRSWNTDFPPLDFAGNLPMYQMERPLFVTDAMRRNQRAVNLADTMAGRAVVTGGFLERVVLDAQQPGRWEKDSEGRNVRFIPDPMVFGSGTVNWLQGRAVQGDNEGDFAITTPDIRWREPSDPTALILASRHFYQNILEEADQVHILISGDATSSGVSRVQARADHKQALLDTAGCAEPMLEWLFTTALLMAEAFMETQDRPSQKFRISVETRLDLGPRTPEEDQADVKLQEAGLKSKKAIVADRGVDDPDAELAEIEEDGRLGEMLKASEGMAVLHAAGLPWEKAAMFLGIDDEEQLNLLREADEQEEERRVQEEEAARERAEALAARNQGEGDDEGGDQPGGPGGPPQTTEADELEALLG